MPDNSYKDGGMRGEALQCPWSNCFPQLYKYSRIPCTLTPFADFREVIDHIWKYHSFLLSCDRCEHRFLGAKRGENHRSDLERLKKRHWDSGCKNTTSDPDHYLKTMTDEQDKILKSWRCTNAKDEASVKPNYDRLCRSLFGSGINVPLDQKYDYYVPKYTVDPPSSHIGEMNLQYIRQRQLNFNIYTTPYSHHNLQTTLNPLNLDDCLQPHDWGLPLQKDSAYESGGNGEALGPQQNTASSSGGVLGYTTDAGHIDWHQFSTMGGFPEDPLADDQRPSSIVVEAWELVNSDLPTG